jgi:sigma-B regulation protein RsbU (phosphoserine phosphatase)
MVIGKTLIKDHTQSGIEPGTIFEEVNNILCESNEGGLFITAYEAVVDLRSGEVRYVNAGHEHPFLMHKTEDGTYKYEEMKIKAGIVLAGMEDMVYKTGTFIIEPGDCLYQYTDGVTEATDKDNNLYGMDRLTRFLNSHMDLDPEKLLPAVRKDIDDFVKNAPQFDDITMLSFKFMKYKD